MVDRDIRSTASSNALHNGLGDKHPSLPHYTSSLNAANVHSESPDSADEHARTAEHKMHDYGSDEPDDPPPYEECVGKDHDLNEVTWDGPDDLENPQNWSTGKYQRIFHFGSLDPLLTVTQSCSAKKWRLTLISALITLNVTFASSAPSSAIMAIQKEFSVSREVSFLLTSLFLGM